MKKKRIPFKKVITEYRRIIQSSTDNQLLPDRIYQLLRPYLQKKEFKSLLTAFRNLNNSEKKSAAYYFTIGKIFLEEAEWERLIGGSKAKCGSKAIEFFKKSIELDSQNLDCYAHLAMAIAFMGNMKKANQIFMKRIFPTYSKITAKQGRKAIMDYFPSIFFATKYMYADYYTSLALVRYAKDETNESLSYLDKAMEKYDYNVLANWLLGRISLESGNLKQASFYFRICRILEPKWPEPYSQQALVLCSQFRYKMASIYVSQALKLAHLYYRKLFRKKYHIYKALCYHTRGMSNWKNGRIDIAYRNFTKMVNIIKHHRIRNWYELCVLPSILRIDKEILDVSTKKTLVSLRKHVVRICLDYSNHFCRSSQYWEPDYIFHDFIRVKQPFLCALLSALDCSFRSKYVSYLKHINDKYKLQVTSDDSDELLFVTRFLDFPERQLSEMGFLKAAQATIALKNFILEIRNDLTIYSSIEKIPRDKQTQLIKSLVPFSDAIDGEATRFHTNECLTKADFLKGMKIFESDLIIGTKKEMQVLQADVEKIIQSALGKKESEMLKQVEEKKIRVLTHEGQKHEEYLPDLEKNKAEYFIWIDEGKPEVSINNKVQKKMANALQSINLLIMLLENHDNLVINKCIFEALDTKGRKSDSGTVRVLKKEMRINVNKMIDNLHKRTNDLLKKHISPVRGAGYRFDSHNIKFCIIYKRPIIRHEFTNS